MKRTTDELINDIKNVYSIENFIDDNKSEYFSISVSEYLMMLLKEKQLKISQVSVGSLLGDYVYKVFNGTRKGDRDVYIAIGIAMKLDLKEFQTMLRLAKYLMLDPRDVRDSVFIYAVSKRLSVMETNDILFNIEKDTLGKMNDK